MWVVLAFIAIAVVVIIGGGGFFILQSLLRILITMQSNDSEDHKKIEAATIAVDNLKAAFTPALKDVADTNTQIVTGLEQLKSSNATITGTMRQIVTDNQSHNKELLEHYVATTNDLTNVANESGKELLAKVIEVPQATVDLVIVSYPNLVNMISERVHTELMPAFLTLTEKIVKDCMEENRKLNVNADASDVQHAVDVAQIDALTHPPTPHVTILGQPSGDEMRAALDAKHDDEAAA